MVKLSAKKFTKNMGKLLCLTFVLAVYSTTTAKAFDSSLLQKCWSDSVLKAKNSEKHIRRFGKGTRLSPPTIDYAGLPPLPGNLRGSIRRVLLPKGKKLVALTLDLCEAHGEVAGYDGKIIDYLRKHKIKATLFVGGKWLLSHSQRAQQLVADPLFEMGNHGWTHGNFRNINRAKMLSELVNTQKAYKITRTQVVNNACYKQSKLKLNKPSDIKLFRFPYGACRKDSLKLVGDNGLLSIQWDVSTGDPSRGQSAVRIANRVLKYTRPGSIIIAHANGRGWNTAKALPRFIPKLIEKGYQFVTVSELLAAGKPVITEYCYDNVIGDLNRYDRRRKRRHYTFKAQNFK